MTLTPGDIAIRASRPSFRALLLTCVATGREIDLYAETLPDSPDHDWSVDLSDLENWVRPAMVPISREERRALAAAIKGWADVGGLRVRWDGRLAE
ncbi:hypothetical protein [Plantactinospora mayteni]|nr:hypothetical protein [Plantactinospora mayteni]